MIKKYEFPSQALAYSELNATIEQVGFLQVEGAENAVDLGHIVLVPAIYENEVEVSPAVMSVGYCVDVMWKESAPAELSAFEVTPQEPKHSFYEENPQSELY